MCGRFRLWAKPKQIADHYQIQEPFPFAPRYNIAPSQEVLAVGQTREGKRKAIWMRWGFVPHWLKAEGLFAFAGLWEHWQDEEADRKIDSCTIVITRANEAVAELHELMPVIIEKADFDLWLDRGVDDPERLLPLLEPVSSQGLEIYAVGLEVNSPAYDSDKVVRKVDSRWTAFH